MSKARQRERKERRQKHGAHGGTLPAVPGEGTGRDVGGLPSHIEIPRHTIQALVQAEEPPPFMKRFLEEGRDPAEGFLEFVDKLQNATPEEAEGWVRGEEESTDS